MSGPRRSALAYGLYASVLSVAWSLGFLFWLLSVSPAVLIGFPRLATGAALACTMLALFLIPFVVSL
jgi:hypothetical protein